MNKRKKVVCFLGPLLLMTAPAFTFTLGLTFGPFANEQYLLENLSQSPSQSRQFPLSYYAFPAFFGGVYFKQPLSGDFFYYVDAAFDIHNGTLSSSPPSADPNVSGYFFYLHNDLNWYPLGQRRLSLGGGLELVVIDRRLIDDAVTITNYNYYVTTHYFCYLNTSLSVPAGPVEIGLKMLYRLLPLTLNDPLGNGEISLQLGWTTR